MNKFLVTVTATGCIVVEAENAEAARQYVTEQVTMSKMQAEGSWSDDSPTVTDVESAEG